MFRHPIVFDPIQSKLVYANIDNPDDDLMEYEEYSAMIKNKEMLQSIIGKLYCKEMALYVVEGYINPKSWELFCEHHYADGTDCDNVEETPIVVIDALKKWNKETYELFEANDHDRHQGDDTSARKSDHDGAKRLNNSCSNENENRLSQQSIGSSGSSTVSKLSSQLGSQQRHSSDINEISPNIMKNST